MIIKYTDTELQSLKEELLKLEIKLQSLSDEKNEYLRDIEDFNLQYNLYLGELIENILRLKKDILYKKNSQKKDVTDSETYIDIKDTISQIESTLWKLENNLEVLDKDDFKYTETLKLYNELKEELNNLNIEKDKIEEEIYNFDNIKDCYSDYTSAKNQYEEYYKDYTNIKEDNENTITLNSEEKLEIKILWKKACKLCHPDIVIDDLKEKAHEVMQLLNDAYSIKDIDKVKAILFDLENGIAFKTESNCINDIELLKAKILEYQEKITKIELEIFNIKIDETFLVISQQEDWNKCFYKIKSNLEKEKENLELEILNILRKQKQKFDLYLFSKDIKNIKTKIQFENYLESCFFELENFFDSKNIENIKELEFDLEKIVHDLKYNKLLNQKNSNIVNAFLILLAQQFEKINHINLMKLILPFLLDCGIKKRIEASLLYLSQENLPKLYFEIFDKIILLLSDSVNDDENNIKASFVFYNFYITAYNYFILTNDESSLNEFNKLVIGNQSKFSSFIEIDSFNQKILSYIKIGTVDLPNINQFLLEHQTQSNICNNLDELTILKEDSKYAKSLYSLDDPTFDDIKNFSSNYIKSIGNPDELFYQLNRGMKVIGDEKLLFKYLQSFGEKHKIKLYSAYDEIFRKIKNQSFNIIDWGCGQAFATMILLDYAKNKNIKLDISEIILVEPSKLALSRGLLHIDILKQKEYKIKTINCEIDCLKEEDILFENNSFTLHLFSNILDIEDFKISDLLNKISSKIQNDCLFVCVSPKINDKRSNRLNLFYRYFDENFNTELISSRDTDIGNATRYEKIFEVKYITEEVIEEKRQEMIIVERNYHIDVINELSQYTDIVVPILNLKILENSINTDPEYAIFKIRKVAEIITTQIYSKYENNEQIISFNDKIRYLAYEQKVFTKASTNYVQTLRTIGNRGVHGNEIDISKLRLDAHLMVIALISFIKEIKDDRLI